MTFKNSGLRGSFRVLLVDCLVSHVEDTDEDTSGFLPRGHSDQCVACAVVGGVDAAHRGNWLGCEKGEPREGSRPCHMFVLGLALC